MNFDPWDFYNKKAKRSGYKARAVYKLDDIQNKYRILNNATTKVLDLGCAPGSRLQFVRQTVKNRSLLALGIDIQHVDLQLEGIHTHEADISDFDQTCSIIDQYQIDSFDVILSDAAPNTIGIKDIDAIKSISLVESTLPLYERYLSKSGRFIIKVFMGPGFDELVHHLKQKYGGKSIKVYKPDASRKQSKEVFVIKHK